MKHARNILPLTVSILGLILLMLSIIRRTAGEDSTTLLCVGLACTTIGTCTRRRQEKQKDE